MARVRHQRDLDRTVAFVLRDFDLLHSAVLVLRTLHDQYGYADIGEALADIPFAEVRIEPGTVPSSERIVDVLMPPHQPQAQVARLVRLLRLDDRGYAGIFGEEMWRDQHEAPDAVILAAAR